MVSQDGIVDHFLGDAVLALFNVPIRRADHVARAVKAAAQIQTAIPEINAAIGEQDLLKVGIGITTGMAYTGIVGSDSCSDYTALGDVVNIASRLQGEAGPGETLGAEDAYEYVKEEYPSAQEQSLQLKGIAEPVRAYLLAQAPDRLADPG